MPQPSYKLDKDEVIGNLESDSKPKLDKDAVLNSLNEQSSSNSLEPGKRVGALSDNRPEEEGLIQGLWNNYVHDPVANIDLDAAAEESLRTVGGIGRDVAQGALTTAEVLGDTLVQGAFDTATFHQAPETSEALSDTLEPTVQLPNVDTLQDTLVEEGFDTLSLGLLPETSENLKNYLAEDNQKGRLEPQAWQNQLARDITPFFVGSAGGTKAVDKARELADSKKAQEFLENAYTRNVLGPMGGVGFVSESEEETGTESFYEAYSLIPGLEPQKAPEWLSIDDNDSPGERKLKMMADDLLLGSALSGVGKIMRTTAGDSIDAAAKAAEDPKLKHGDRVPEGEVTETLAERGPIIEKTDGTTINLRKFNTEDEVRNLIKEVSESNPEVMENARRRGQTHNDTRKMAENLGLSVDDVERGLQGNGYTAEELYALNNIILPKSGKDVMDLAKRVSLSDNPGDEIIQEFHRAYNRHVNIQEQVIGARSEAGRALNILKANDNKSTEEYIRLQSELSGWDTQRAKKIAGHLSRYAEIDATQGQANKFMRDATRGSWGDIGKEIWYNSLLSGASTHITNMLSNTLYLGATVGYTGGAAATGGIKKGVGKTAKGIKAGSQALGPRVLGEETAQRVGNTLGNTPGARVLNGVVDWADMERVYGTEAAAEMYGLMKSIPEAVTGGVKTFFREEPTDPQTKAEVLSRRATPTIYGGDIANLFRKKGGHGKVNLVEDPQTGQLKYDYTGTNLEKFKGVGKFFTPDDPMELKLLGKQARFFGRALVAEDEFFKTVHMRADFYKQGYRKARDEGFKGQEALTRADDLAKNPTKEMVDHAIERARIGTFTDKPGPWLQKAQGLINQTPGAFFVAPFIRTPGKLIHRSTEMLPGVGLLHSNMRQALSEGGRAADEAMGKQIVGSGLFGSFTYLGYTGLATGSLSPDPSARSREYHNMQPNSVRLPGDEYYRSFGRLEPLGIVAGIAADVGNTIRRYQFEQNADIQQDSSLIADLVVNSFVENFLSKTWSQGIANVAEGLTNPQKSLQYSANQLANTAVPTIMAHHQKALDPELKRAETLSETIMSRWKPWGEALAKGLNTYQGNLNPRVGFDGQPIEFDTPAGPGDDEIEGNPFTDLTYYTRMASPIYRKEYKEDPVWLEFTALNVNPRKPPEDIKGVELSKDQYFILHSQEKKIGHNFMEQFIGTEMWQELEPYPEVKREFIADVYSTAYRAAVLDTVIYDEHRKRNNKYYTGGNLLEKLGGEKRLKENILGNPAEYRHRRAVQQYRDGGVDALKKHYENNKQGN